MTRERISTRHAFQARNRADSSAVPPHLAHSSWINFEAAAAISVARALSVELSRLKQRVTTNRVHKTRVALRRWFSVWAILRQDNWESPRFKKQVIRPARRLLKMLGQLRDWDVNIELGEILGCSRQTLSLWKAERKRVRRKMKKLVESLDLDDLEDTVSAYLTRRAEKVEKRSIKSSHAAESAYTHIDRYLGEQEVLVGNLAARAQTTEELHELRLGIKRWRYILAEFFGLTNLELVRAQQLLGQLNDLDRVLPLIEKRHAELRALNNLNARRQSVLAEFSRMRDELPYGLRPRISAPGA